MDVTLICSMFEELPRQGPGSEESTAFASTFIPSPPKKGKILDIGCGSGMQTVALARLCPESRVTATDIYQPFLDAVLTRAKKAGVDNRIVTRQASMDSLPFDAGSFDIVWAEGSSFIIGILPALQTWKKFLKPGGYLVFSDCTWYTDTPSLECKEFFDAISPGMPTESEVEEMIQNEGYSLVGSFRLPDSAWWDNFYHPLTDRLGMLKEKYANNPDAQEIIRGLEWEMEIRRKYPGEYGYTFFIMKKESR